MQGTLLPLLVASICFTGTFQAEWGGCQKPPVQQDFNMSQYLGIWYEIERSGERSKTDKCIYEKYQKEGNQIELLTQVVRADGTVDVFEGEIYFAKNEKEKAKFYFKILSEFSRWKSLDFSETSAIRMPYWVLATDYTNYSLVYACTSFINIAHNYYTWILSRERHLSENITNYLHDILTLNKINKTMSQSNQRECPTFT